MKLCYYNLKSFYSWTFYSWKRTAHIWVSMMVLICPHLDSRPMQDWVTEIQLFWVQFLEAFFIILLLYYMHGQIQRKSLQTNFAFCATFCVRHKDARCNMQDLRCSVDTIQCPAFQPLPSFVKWDIQLERKENLCLKSAQLLNWFAMWPDFKRKCFISNQRWYQALYYWRVLLGVYLADWKIKKSEVADIFSVQRRSSFFSGGCRMCPTVFNHNFFMREDIVLVTVSGHSIVLHKQCWPDFMAGYQFEQSAVLYVKVKWGMGYRQNK